jgi:hypothetical protein
MDNELKAKLFANVLQGSKGRPLPLLLPDHHLPGRTPMLIRISLAFVAVGLLILGAIYS